MQEENKKTRTTAYLQPDLYEKLRLESFQTKESQSNIIIKALEKYFQEKEKPGA